MSKWIKVDITTTTEGIEPVSAILLEQGLSYEVSDANDFKQFLEKKESHWDYIDDDLMKLADAPTIITLYLSDQKQGIDQLAAITRELDRLRFISYNNQWGELKYELSSVDEEDWSTSWKQYYKPIVISDKLVICPEWLDYEPKNGQIVVKMDPGMAFGTGSHESTKLCLEFLDKVIKGSENVLDVGCGSGILSIAAVLMGAKSAQGSDIDQVAVDIAIKNAKLNGVSKIAHYKKGSFAQGIKGKFDIIFANIVADAIIAFSPEVKGLLAENGYFICSGIIDERSDQVEESLVAAGLVIKEKKEEKGWVAFLCTAS